MDKSEENRMEKNKNSGAALARKMAVSLVCGLAAGFAFMMLREKLVASGNSGIWQTINDLLFQDITICMSCYCNWLCPILNVWFNSFNNNWSSKYCSIKNCTNCSIWTLPHFF